MAILLRRRKLGKTSCEAIASMSKTGIVCVRNDKHFPPDHDIVIRWGTTSLLPIAGFKTTVNTSNAIHWVADKLASRFAMAEKGLSPKTWLHYGDYQSAYIEDEVDQVVVRKRTHSQGRDLYHCVNAVEVIEAVRKFGKGNYYISEYIPKVAEYRVLVGSGRAVWVAKKTPADPDAVAWNVAQGGRFDNVRWNEWPMEAIRVSIEAFKLSGLDFGGVDVMVGPDGRCYVLEINSAPSQTSPYRQSCMAKFFDYIVENGKAMLPIGNITDWKDVVHPAISEKARM